MRVEFLYGGANFSESVEQNLKCVGDILALLLYHPLLILKTCEIVIRQL